MAARSLRTRLVATVLLLLAVAAAAIAGTTAFLMDRFLVTGLDSGDLKFAFSRCAPAPPGSPKFTIAPYAPIDLKNSQVKDGIAAVFDNGTMRQVVASGRDYTTIPVPPETVAALRAVPATKQPLSVDLGPAGAYRAVASPIPGPGNGVLVVAVSEAPVRGTLSILITVELIVTAVALLGAGVAGALTVSRSLRPLERVAATAARVSALPLDRGEVLLVERVPDVDPATEVGQVGAALNQLLDHVSSALEARQESEVQLRQFVADASHELRTPLAAIRGYAELTRRTELPEETTYSLQRISSQAERMTTLVEDMLLLARLDAGRPLERREVDLTRLVVDGISDAHAAGPDHHWRLDVPDEPLTVPGDASRLAQVLANLLANARTHTPAGTSVTVSLTRDPDSVRLTISDDGPGITPELLPHVFERFARGSTSRSRDNGSTGLGLAIVDAVVGAHGGAVGVASTPGCTTFTVHLPTGAIAPAPASVEESGGAPTRAWAHAQNGDS